MTLDAFEEDTRTQYAVKYALHVVGEAAGKVPSAIHDRFPHVPWRQIIAMRNRLAHDYLGECEPKGKPLAGLDLDQTGPILDCRAACLWTSLTAERDLRELASYYRY